MESRLVEAIAHVLRKKNRKFELVPNFRLMSLRNDIGLDSLDLAELTVRIESEFGIDIFEDGIVETVGEILEKLEEK